jgi:hypothetical protein
MSIPLVFNTQGGTDAYLKFILAGINAYSLYHKVFMNDPSTGLATWNTYLWFVERGVPVPYFLIYDIEQMLRNKHPQKTEHTKNQHIEFFDELRIISRKYLRRRFEPKEILQAYVSEIILAFDFSKITPIIIGQILPFLLYMTSSNNSKTSTWINEVNRLRNSEDEVANVELQYELFSHFTGKEKNVFLNLPELLQRHFYSAKPRSISLSDYQQKQEVESTNYDKPDLNNKLLDSDLIRLYRNAVSREYPYYSITKLSVPSIKPKSQDEETSIISAYLTVGRGEFPILPSEIFKGSVPLIREISEQKALVYKDIKPQKRPIKTLIIFGIYLPSAEFTVSKSGADLNVTILKLAAVLAAHDVLRYAVHQTMTQFDIAFYLFSERESKEEKEKAGKSVFHLANGEDILAKWNMRDENSPAFLEHPGVFKTLFYHTEPNRHPSVIEKQGPIGFVEMLNSKEQLKTSRGQWDEFITFLIGNRSSIFNPQSAETQSELESAVKMLPSSPEKSFIILTEPQTESNTNNNTPSYRLYWKIGENEKKESVYPFEDFRNWVINQVLKFGK